MSVEHVAVPVPSRKERLLTWAGVAGSAFMFATVYTVLFVAYRAATAVTAAYFDLEPVLHLDRVRYLRSDLWDPHTVKRVFITGSIALAVVMLLSFILFTILRKNKVFIRLFLLWALVISTAMVSQRLIGVLFASYFQFRDLGDVGLELSVYGAYHYFDNTEFMMMALVGFLLSFTVGLVVAKPFLQTAWSQEQIGAEHTRLMFLYMQVMLPSFLGAILVVALTFPENIFPNFLAFVNIGLILLLTITRAMLLGPLQIPRQKVWEKWPIVPTVLFALTAILSLTVLKQGIRL
jgi:hypothetical protein